MQVPLVVLAVVVLAVLQTLVAQELLDKALLVAQGNHLHPLVLAVEVVLVL
jgi:hypothetical protein